MRILIIICLFFISSTLLAQVTEDSKNPFFIQQVNFDLSKKNEVGTVGIQKNNVPSTLITQIGYNNVLSIKGNQNDYQDIEQRGNKNYYNFADYYNSRTSRMKVVQEGTSNTLQIFGTNSFSDNIIVRQKSNYKSIIIRNF